MSSSARLPRREPSTEDDHRFYIPPRLLKLLKWNQGQRILRTLMDQAKRELAEEAG